MYVFYSRHFRNFASSWKNVTSFPSIIINIIGWRVSYFLKLHLCTIKLLCVLFLYIWIYITNCIFVFSMFYLAAFKRPLFSTRVLLLFLYVLILCGLRKFYSMLSVYRWYRHIVRGRFVYDTWDNESDSVASWLSAHVYYTLPSTKPPTSYHRFGQDLSYK